MNLSLALATQLSKWVGFKVKVHFVEGHTLTGNILVVGEGYLLLVANEREHFIILNSVERITRE